MHLSTKEPVQSQARRCPLILRVIWNSRIEDQDRANSKSRRQRCRNASVVRLLTSNGDRDLRAVSDRLREQVFEFAYLVAAETRSGEIVTLDEQMRAG